MKNLLITLSIALCFLTNCSKQSKKSDISLSNKEISLFIAMPKNSLVFDHISLLLYDELHQQCLRIGYNIIDRPSMGYTLNVMVKGLRPIQKFVSPDLLLFHNSISLELHCHLCNESNTTICQKTFFFSALLSKPKNPIMNSDFLDFEYKKLFKRTAPVIERYFRPYILKSVDKL